MLRRAPTMQLEPVPWRKCNERRNLDLDRCADSAFAAPYRDDLSERSQVRIPEKPSLAHVHRLGSQLSDHVLRVVWTGAELETGDWRNRRADLPDCHLRHLRRNGRVTVRDCCRPGLRSRLGMAASQARQPDASVCVFRGESNY